MDALAITAPPSQLDAELAKLAQQATATARNAGRMKAELEVVRTELSSLLPFIDQGWRRDILIRLADGVALTLRLVSETEARS